MNLEFKTAMRECYITRSGKRVVVGLEPLSSEKRYFVSVRMPGTIEEVIANGCSRREAMQIAKEQYYAA